MTDPTPFQISIPQSQLDDLRDRLARTIWPSEIEGAGWSYGPTRAWVQELVGYLLGDRAGEGGYDWRRHEAELNRHPQFTTEIDGQKIHFLHVRSARKDAVPLLLIHGWPGSFVEFLGMIDSLAQGYHLVIPSLPGFAFSGPTRERGWNNGRIARALLELMRGLGYQRFGIQGGDAGAIIGPEVARIAPEAVIGVHVNAATMGFIPMGPVDPAVMAKLTPLELTRMQRLQRFMAEHFGFNAVQSQRPQAVAFAVSDSPAGLLAWISELWTSFGDLPDAIDRDRFLTNFVIYWLTGTAASSMRLYFENVHDPAAWAPKANSGVPTAVAVFKNDEVPIRHFGEQANTIVRWTDFADVEAGHYAAIQVPDVLAADVRAFFESLAR